MTPARLFTAVVFLAFVALMLVCLWLRRDAALRDPRLRSYGDVGYYTYSSALMAAAVVFFAAIFMWGLA